MAKFAPVSPYSYCMGDPVNFIDPNGMEAYTITDVNDIARFLNYLQSGRASYEQMVAHLTGEGGGGCGGGGGYTSLFYTPDYWIEEVRIVGQRPSSQGGRIDLQGEKIITQMVDKFREIHRNKGINPYSGNYYHVHDIVDASSLPEKYWFNRIFGSMTNDGAKGTSYFGDKAAQWYLVDRNFLNNYGENYISYIYGDHPGGDMYRIRAMHNNETIISLIFYDYDLYQTMYNRIFK